ncbi:MAG: peptide ABC transporter substrate-binding protein [Anaerolineaceae bacterium]|nr:peptide ABC transporter substrate-binding protein [Anaerolineaceae bacterium]
MSKYLRFIGLALVVMMLMSLTLGVSAQEKVLHTALGMVGGDLNTIDPSLSEVAGEIQMINEMFVGLTGQGEADGALLPGLASSWDVSDDGFTFTFHLMEGVPWVHYNADSGAVEQVMDDMGNPRYVTANDVVYAWKRTLDPATASTYAYVPAEFIVNGQAFNGGEATADDLGIQALDDYTVEITSPVAVSFAPYIYGLWMVSPLPSWAVEAGGDSWTEPEYYTTYGPFALKEWEHDVSITLIKNPFWPGSPDAPQAILDEVVFHFLDPQAAMAEYEAGTISAVNPPLEEMDRVRADATLSAELTIGARDCTYYLGVNQDKAPLGDSVHLRRAMSLAVDRQSIVDNVTKGGQTPARWFARPGLIAAPTLDTNPEAGIGYDPMLAQEELAMGLEELGVASAADLPTITLAYNDSSGHAAIAQAIQQMWKDTLGIEVQLSAMDPTTYFSTLSEDAPTIYRSGWCSDYPDADNFLRVVFRSDSSQNDPNFNSPEFDALVDQARAETDLETRRELYAAAEDILSRDQVGIIPIYWYTTVQLTKPNIERTYPALGSQRYEKWDIN